MQVCWSYFRRGTFQFFFFVIFCLKSWFGEVCLVWEFMIILFMELDFDHYLELFFGVRIHDHCLMIIILLTLQVLHLPNVLPNLSFRCSNGSEHISSNPARNFDHHRSNTPWSLHQCTTWTDAVDENGGFYFLLVWSGWDLFTLVEKYVHLMSKQVCIFFCIIEPGKRLLVIHVLYQIQRRSQNEKLWAWNGRDERVWFLSQVEFS